jgi:hypothetical protein
MASSASPSLAVATGRTHVELDSGVMTGSANVELKPNSQTESTQADFEAGMPESRVVIDYEDRVLNGGYGWVCVACVFWLNAHTWGINSVGKTLQQHSHSRKSP